MFKRLFLCLTVETDFGIIGVMKITQHVPNYISGCDPRVTEFESLEELLEIEWVKQWSTHDMKDLPFWRYSESKGKYDIILMAEWKEGDKHTWWVLGYLSESVGLPEWVYTKND